jgi:GntR family transcriptional regulator
MTDERITAYDRVYRSIKEAILNSEYKKGSLLPPEPALEKKFQVSRITIRRAIEILSAEGYVDVRQGYGTTVSEPHTAQKLNYITSFSETLASYGYNVSSDDTHIDLVVPAQNVLKALGLDENAHVIRFQSLQLANGTPIALITNYIHMALVPNIEEHLEVKFISVYKFLENNFGLAVDFAKDKITACCADIMQSQLLGLHEGSPLINLKRTTYFKSAPLTYDVFYIDAMRYAFSVNLNGAASGH